MREKQRKYITLFFFWSISKCFYFFASSGDPELLAMRKKIERYSWKKKNKYLFIIKKNTKYMKRNKRKYLNIKIYLKAMVFEIRLGILII